MTYLTKSFARNFITTKHADILDSIEKELYYVAGIDCRELIGVIHLLWVTEYITTEERDKHYDTFYELKTKCEFKIGHCL